MDSDIGSCFCTAASLAYFMHNFSETTKMGYKGEQDDSEWRAALFSALTTDCLDADKVFHFTCFNVEDTDDPQIGLRNGDLTISGHLLRQEVFDPVVHQVRVSFSSDHEGYSIYDIFCPFPGPGTDRRPNEED